MIEQLFSIPVFNTKVKNFNKIQSEITAGLRNSKFSINPDWGRTHYLSDPTFSENWLTKHSCNTLLSEIDTCIKEYQDGEYTMKNSWVALFKEHNYGHIHTHGKGISGVYYYKVKGSTGNLFFRSGRDWQGRVVKECEEGQLLLFPSDLEHGITTNTTSTSRLSISFNFL
tara:strand:- start:275 stop:784 length:510 start_codon:yes stop_codon:yes gene_type:complete